LILGGGFFAAMGFFELQSMSFVYNGCTLLFVGIIGLIGALIAKRKHAGYFFIIFGVAILLPVVLAAMHIGDGGGDAKLAALCFIPPALIVTGLWCKGGVNNINS